MVEHSIAEIARAAGLRYVGNGDLCVRSLAEPSRADRDDLAVAMTKSYAEALAASPARSAVVWDNADWETFGLEAALFAPKPRVALAALTARFQHAPDETGGRHPTAMIDPSAQIGEGADIGPFAVIGADVRIGRNARIDAHVTIGSDVEIGDDALIYPGVRIGARCRIGARMIAHANAVIGADGFSFERPPGGLGEDSGYLRIHSLAAVEIGDDVEIGAVTTIDRGTLAPTRVGNGTKIDNQVQVGHNCRIGDHCLLCAHVGLAGSTEIGDRVVLGGKVGVADHTRIGSDTMVAGGSLVAANVPPGSIMIGIPATGRAQFNEQYVALRRLPRLAKQVAEIRNKLGL